MKTRYLPDCMPRIIACVLAILQLATPAAVHAAVTSLVDIPIVVQNRVPPNIMVTLDNSGSMHWGFMPGDAIANAWKNCFASPEYNTLYYDPQLKYFPGKRADGTPYPQANFNSAFVNAYDLPYEYATQGVTPRGNGYASLGSKRTGPVNLATSFQSSFDSMSHYRDEVDPDNRSIWYVTNPQPAYYYKYIGAQPSSSNPAVLCNDANFRKVVVSATSGPGGTDERQNFANWFSYYRTRLMMLKTVLTQTFSVLDGRYRIGLSTIDNNGSVSTDPSDNGKIVYNQNLTGDNFIEVDSFEGAQKNKWFSTVINMGDGGPTPMIEAVRRIGEYYTRGDQMGAVYKGIRYRNPIPQATESCQRNYQIAATDGYWNIGNNDQNTPVGDNDFRVPALPNGIQTIYDPIAKAQLTSGQLFPPLFREGARNSDNLADVTMKYWISNMRPGARTPLAVPTTSRDPARWPHMTTFGISLGESGDLPNDPQTEDDLRNGRRTWPTPTESSSTTIDDLWHASLNGHGQYVRARQGDDLRTGIERMLNEINSGTYSGAAVTVSNHNLAFGNPRAFESSYDPGGWSGELSASNIDPNTAVITTPPVWTAQAQLDSMPWTLRNIATSVVRNGRNTGVAFQPGSLSAATRLRLNSPEVPPGPADNAGVIAFLRGDRSREVGTYRSRTHVLGDIIGAEAVYVGPPSARYVDVKHAEFAANNKTRVPMVYQGANDGMLHAFNANTGAEIWAYVPGVLLETPLVSSARGLNYPGTSSLVNLSLASKFSHLAYVDGTPTVDDIDLTNTGTGTRAKTGSWITLLVGGLNKGGRGYYALNVTTVPAPKRTASDPDTAAAFAHWEFPQAGTPAATIPHIGYSYGKPVIVKTPETGWVVLVTSGYNNGADTGGDGRGHLFVLNAATGDVIADLVTTAGSPTSPSGLAQVSAYTEFADQNNTTDFVYGGDLGGNLWRFDLRGPVAGWQGNVKLLTKLHDGNNVAQPITTAPELAKVDGKRIVYVGTGRYLGLADLPGNPGADQTQSIYGLIDDLQEVANANPHFIIGAQREQLVRQSVARVDANSPRSVATTAGVDFSVKKGWYLDLPNGFERLVSAPTLALGTLSFTTVSPGSDVCEPGGNARVYNLDYATGGAVVVNNVAQTSATYAGNSLATRPVSVRTKNGKMFDLTRTVDPAVTRRDAVPVNEKTSVLQRTLWREVIAR